MLTKKSKGKLESKLAQQKEEKQAHTQTKGEIMQLLSFRRHQKFLHRSQTNK
jgi:hypothetical protein